MTPDEYHHAKERLEAALEEAIECGMTFQEEYLRDQLTKLQVTELDYTEEEHGWMNPR